VLVGIDVVNVMAACQPVVQASGSHRLTLYSSNRTNSKSPTHTKLECISP